MTALQFTHVTSALNLGSWVGQISNTLQNYTYPPTNVPELRHTSFVLQFEGQSRKMQEDLETIRK